MSTIVVGVIRGGRRLPLDVLLRRAPILLDETDLGRLVELVAGCQHVHHDHAERHGDRHVEEEHREGPPGQGSEVAQAAELRHAGGQRGEHQGNNHEEEQAQERLSQRVENVCRYYARPVQHPRRELADDQRQGTRDCSDREADEDTVC